jgi:hypothetical protein
MLEDKEIQKNKRRRTENKHKRQYQALLVVENNEPTHLVFHCLYLSSSVYNAEVQYMSFLRALSHLHYSVPRLVS